MSRKIQLKRSEKNWSLLEAELLYVVVFFAGRKGKRGKMGEKKEGIKKVVVVLSLN